MDEIQLCFFFCKFFGLNRVEVDTYAGYDDGIYVIRELAQAKQRSLYQVMLDANLMPFEFEMFASQ